VIAPPNISFTKALKPELVANPGLFMKVLLLQMDFPELITLRLGYLKMCSHVFTL